MAKKIYIIFLGSLLVFSFLPIGVLAGDLTAPQKISPPDGFAMPGETITFQWNGVSGADKYEINVLSAPSGSVVERDVITGKSQVYTLNPQTDYWWNVKACHGTFLWLTDCDSQDFGQEFKFTTGGIAPLQITTTEADLKGTVGKSYSVQLLAKGGTEPYTWRRNENFGPLPAGLSFSSTGLISGLPTQGLTTSQVFTVVDQKGVSVGKAFNLTIFSAPLEILTNSSDLPKGWLNTQYVATLQAQGGKPPYIFQASGLPQGLSILGDKITGTPLGIETSNFTALVTDDGGQGVTIGKVLSIIISPISNLPAPEVISPQNGASDIPVQVILYWGGVIGATWYNWVIEETGGVVVSNGGSSLTNSIVVTLKNSTNYTWRVTPCEKQNSGCTSYYSSATFITIAGTTPGGTTPGGTTPPGGTTGGGGPTIKNPLNADTFGELVDDLIKFVFYVSLAVAPLMIIYAGFLWVTAAGNAARLKTAQTIILYTSIGLAVILLARGLVAIIKSALGG